MGGRVPAAPGEGDYPAHDRERADKYEREREQGASASGCPGHREPSRIQRRRAPSWGDRTPDAPIRAGAPDRYQRARRADTERSDGRTRYGPRSSPPSVGADLRVRANASASGAGEDATAHPDA